MPEFIPLSVPCFQGNEEKYAMTAIRDGWVSTAGTYVTDFEKSVAHFVGVEKAVACQSGTAGLHISLMLMGVTREDIVLVPTLTFIAAVNPVMYIGAKPVFMDCDDSLCMDPQKLREYCQTKCHLQDGRLIESESGRHVKAVIVVHIFGNMADMVEILKIAKEFHLRVVEDATEALGTYYTEGALKGKFAGTMGDIGVYSFNGNKIITTGGGGMIVSRDETLLAHARHLTTQAKSNEVYFFHDEVGYNYRLTNMQAALGLAQMEELPDFIKVKKRNYDLYKAGIAGIEGLSLLPFREGIRSNHWFYSLMVQKPYRLDRDQLITYLHEHQIQTRPIWGLIHQQKPYQGAEAYRIENASYYYRYVVNLPCSSGLTQSDVERVIRTIKG